VSSQPLHHPRVSSAKLNAEFGWWDARVLLPELAAAGLRSSVSAGVPGEYAATLNRSANGHDGPTLTSLDDLVPTAVRVAADILEWVYDYWHWHQDHPDFDSDIPRVESRDDLLTLLVVQWVHVHPSTAEGSDFGIELEAPLDIEHWIGVRFRAGQAVAVGTAETAFREFEGVEWILEHMGNGRTPWAHR
jgi:hypothetical protein